MVRRNGTGSGPDWQQTGHTNAPLERDGDTSGEKELLRSCHSPRSSVLFIQSFWEHPAGHAGAAWGPPLTSHPSAAPPHHLGLSSNAISLESHPRSPDLTKTPSLSHTRDNALMTPKSSASFIYFLAYSLPVPSEDAVP